MISHSSWRKEGETQFQDPTCLLRASFSFNQWQRGQVVRLIATWQFSQWDYMFSMCSLRCSLCFTEKWWTTWTTSVRKKKRGAFSGFVPKKKKQQQKKKFPDNQRLSWFRTWIESLLLKQWAVTIQFRRSQTKPQVLLAVYFIWNS